MDNKINFLDTVEITQLNKIHHPSGDIYHVLKKSDQNFSAFGEAYFTTIQKGSIKGWKKHTKMCMNLVVPVGNVCFHFYNKELNESYSLCAGEMNYIRITVHPGIWMAFEGLSEGLNLVLNIANIQHDPLESENVEINSFPLNRYFSGK